MHISAYTTAGVRPENEDTIYPPQDQPEAGEGRLLIVADGLGGHQDGKLASRIVCEKLTGYLLNRDPIDWVVDAGSKPEAEIYAEFLTIAFQDTGRAVAKEAQTRGSDMHSTALAVLIHNGTAYAGYLGDSALFASPEGQLPPAKLTSEHRAGKRLTRSLGLTEKAESSPEIRTFAFTDESILVMGSDGFWEHVAPEQMSEILAHTPPYAAAKVLARTALQNESRDNVSVIVAAGEQFVHHHAADQVKAWARAIQGDLAHKAEEQAALIEFAARYIEQTQVQKIVREWLGKDCFEQRFPQYAERKPALTRTPSPAAAPAQAASPTEKDSQADSTLEEDELALRAAYEARIKALEFEVRKLRMDKYELEEQIRVTRNTIEEMDIQNRKDMDYYRRLVWGFGDKLLHFVQQDPSLMDPDQVLYIQETVNRMSRRMPPRSSNSNMAF